MTSFTLVGGRVVDPATGRDERADVAVVDGVVAEVGGDRRGELVDVTGLVVAPGLVDVHVHLREPGGEQAETIGSGTLAAAAGGYTAVFAMPNTQPVADDVATVEHVRAVGRREGWCDVDPVAAITVGQRGVEVVDIPALAAAGVRYLSDDGHPVASAAVMREALRGAALAGLVVGNHAEEPTLTVDAQVNEGPVAERLGFRGWPHEAEEVMVARDIILAHGAGATLHVPHLSTAGAVALVRHAKRVGVRVTAEATPHHLALTDEATETGETSFKVNPPLRSAEDRAAVRAALVDGTIDLIATDHAPHAPDAKARGWSEAPCGMLGAETALAVTLTELVHTGVLSLSEAIERMSCTPARVMGLADHGGPIAPGAPANLVVFDPGARWTVEPARLHSRSRNSPFCGRSLVGRVVHTILRGTFTVRDGEPGRRPDGGHDA